MTATPISGELPSATCREAVQQIQQNKIGGIELYRQKENTHMVPANSVTNILMYPRSALLADGTYNPFLEIGIDLSTYPDHDCNPQILKAVKQVNAHLPKDQQVKISWLYRYS